MGEMNLDGIKVYMYAVGQNFIYMKLARYQGGQTTKLNQLLQIYYKFMPKFD